MFLRTALTLSLLLPLFIAQASLAGDNNRPLAGQVKGLNLSGKVSADGKMLRTDDDNDWSISNPDVLKGLEGHYITVKCRIDQNKRALRVLFLVEQGQTKHAVNLGDPAFRR